MPTLDFKGKQFVYSHHLSVPFRELKVVADKSLPLDGNTASLDDNLIIHGDNLEALKALLPTHAGKVDCIFIDPPYNTGNEGWCYNDNVRSPLMQEWLKKSANPVDKEDMERHDKWLCMMWPRLILLYELLADDGVLFVTIDDNEQHRLRMILDEIFQKEESFYGHIAWQKKYATSNDAKGFSAMHDHVLVYRKSEDFERNLFERTEGNDKNYRYEDEQGVFRVSDYTCNKTADERPNLYYPVVNPNTGEEIWPKKSRVWSYSKQEHENNLRNNLVYWGVDGKGNPGFKRYKHALKGGGGTVPSTWWPHDFASHTDEAKKTLRNIMGNDSVEFFTPKPVTLLKRILEIATDPESIILDSFAGSGTTAHAVLEANKSDEGNRKFILIECEDYADKVTAERVRRVINGYPFKGNQKQELLSEKITWSVFEKKHAELLEQIAKVEAKHSNDFDKIKKELKDGVLTVTGERTVDEFAPGIGGSFTYCTLGEPIQIESLLTGEAMPSFDALARYVFYTATGQSLETVAKASADGFIGETDLFRIHLFYRPDSEWLRSNEAALNAEKVEVIAKNNATKKRTIVFAVAKFMSQKDLTEKRIEFCQLPYAIHRIMGA
ncbi:site-specific DNA-methyltransferase [Vibrio metschnikovii]|nr:site-specific DNA-methyltransferase [Vibrio metschnikovii]EKO3704080.1 site-specific DNA-methyltransferase [Vibrio metschnikovii]EKO3735088.1 site-specific DNA-methyltransferase [Vibrio metschnikovii]EKO3744740.1 site-specific DNA-methyltransferase [Vibrio metschnikovii]EKO3896165.1 site-specific DNA-methyltransferase [Vibrio metschnikovii]